MSTLTYSHTLTNGTTADADEVMANFANVSSIVNGSIDGTNISSSSALSVASITTSANAIIGGTLAVTGLSTLVTANIAGVDVGSGTVDKTRTIALTTSGAIPATTNGANQAKIAGTNFEYYQLEFDKDTDESVYWIFPIPAQYDGGDVRFKVIAKCATVTSGTVVWVITTKAINPTATWDVALDTTLTFSAATVSPTAGNIFTVAKVADPGWGIFGIAILRLYRDTSEDSAAEDVDVVAVNAEWEVT